LNIESLELWFLWCKGPIFDALRLCCKCKRLWYGCRPPDSP